jgi:hypothetical protein
MTRFPLQSRKQARNEFIVAAAATNANRGADIAAHGRHIGSFQAHSCA